MKLPLLILFFQMSMQIYDFPSMINPSLSEAYSLTNGGMTTQSHWGDLMPQSSNVFNTDEWKNSGKVSMFNMNSLAPYAGDRYTGYDSFLNEASPMSIASNSYHPSPVNVNTDESLHPSMADFNTAMYRNFYNRYYSFFTRNLDLIKAKTALLSNPNDYANISKKTPLTYKDLISQKNFFDGNGEASKRSTQDTAIPFLRVIRGNGQQKERILRLRNKASKSERVLRELKQKVTDIKMALNLIENAADTEKEENTEKNSNMAVGNKIWLKV